MARLMYHVLRFVTLLGGRHWYLSTGCLHGGDGHAYCQIQAQRYDGSTKHRSHCKVCDIKCVCWCHRARPAGGHSDGA